MNSNKKLYLYSGLAIALSVVAYVVITRKKESISKSTEGGKSDAETDIATTTTGDTVEQEQLIIPEALSNILKKTSAQATATLQNKPIYTKVENVKVRSENYVNNGFIDNIMSTINDRDFLLGNVIQVVDDKGKLKNADGRVLKWFKIRPLQSTLDEMNKNKDFLTARFLPTTTKEIFIREDVVKFK